MNLDVVVRKRDFHDPVAFPDVIMTPERYGWAARGGPDFAVIRAAGEELALWSLLNWLRAPVEIIDERGESVWWGFIDEVTVRVGKVKVGVSLREMVNRVAVAYSYITPGSNTVGTRATTSWSQNDDSVATYGTKELLRSRDGCSTDTANAHRDAILDRLKYPLSTIRVTQGGTQSATLHCLGWWHTLDWEHYARDAGLESHTDGSQSQAVGETTDDEQVAQSFQLTGGEAWAASTVAVKLAKHGSPADNFLVDLCSDNAGVPGTILATGTIAGANVAESRDWATLTLDSEVSLALATTYWLRARRSGAIDPDNYYTISVDEDLGYASGSLLLYNGSSWTARDPDADMAFRVEGVEETTAQIERVVADKGQFLTGVDTLDAAGIRVSQYRDGDTTALYVIKQLLNDGTSAGKRLLATVTRERELRVYEEPDRDDVELYLGADGRPVDLWGNDLLAHTCPVAKWCELRDVIPTSVNTRTLSDPSAFFVERAEYDVNRQIWRPEARGIPSPWEIGLITEA